MADWHKNGVFWGICWVLGCVLLTCCKGESPDSTVTISAASSLAEAIQDLQAAYSRQHPEQALSINIGGSSSLARQILAGAPVDVFLSANSDQLDRLVQKGFVRQRRAFTTNRLVVVVPVGSTSKGPYTSLGPILEQTTGPIVIGDRAVPAGAYAHRALEKYDLLDRNRSRLVLMRNVRQVLGAVASGNAEVGFVYATDVDVAGGDVRVVWEVPEGDVGSIVYEAGLVRRDGAGSANAQAFYRWLQSEPARSILQARGFEPIQEGDRTP